MNVVWQKFKEFAFAKGYNKKIVGDNAFQNKKTKIMRLISAIKGDIIVYEEGVGRYSIAEESKPKRKKF